jgi:hypothetical protein
MKNLESLQEKLHNFQMKFSEDEEVQKLIIKLRKRFNELQEKHFSDDDFLSDDFEEMNEQYWSVCRESDVDELDIFTFLWFN